MHDDPTDVPAPRRVLRQIILTAVISVVSAGAATMSCGGQSFSLRQARALEAIQHQLEALPPHAPCGGRIAP